MRISAKIKLQPTTDQHAVLLKTLEAANAACNEISKAAWDKKIFGQFSLHKIVYCVIRDNSFLGAQMIVRAIAKVADAYKIDKKVCRTFKPHGAFPYDSRILNFNIAKKEVSIWTLNGRQHIPYQCGIRQHQLLEGKRGEADLCFIEGNFYLSVSCEVEEPTVQEFSDFLGIDLGIVNLATDSDGTIFSGKAVEDIRRKFSHRRRNLQRNGTKACKRKLKQISKKQSRYQADTNHVISKHIVRTAQDTNRGIALEDLKGIRDRGTVFRRRQRNKHANWSFSQLRLFIEYKAKLAGIRVTTVDPRNTSRTCTKCNHIDKANRKTQSLFLCLSCGHSAPADFNAALNIRARALVNVPMVAASC